jgi:predicted ATPase
VLVGRTRELEAVAEVMDQARAGVFRAVHLIGEAGVGKTTLAERVADLAASQGWLVARGCAWHNAAAPPYWVWAQVLDAMTHAAAAPVDTPLLALVTGTINADAIESDPPAAERR